MKIFSIINLLIVYQLTAQCMLITYTNIEHVTQVSFLIANTVKSTWIIHTVAF